MSPEQGVLLLQELTRRWRLRVVLACALQALGETLLALAALELLAPGLGGGRMLAAGLGLGAVLFALNLALRRRRLGSPRMVALHLDRQAPQLEDSCELLLRPPAALPLLGRLQQGRVLRALEGLAPERLLPRGWLRPSAAVLACTGVLALGLHLAARELHGARPPEAAAAALPAEPAAAPTPRPPQMAAVQVRIEPPAYTRRPASTVAGLDLSAPEGSRLTWSVTMHGPVDAVTLVFGDGKRLGLPHTGSPPDRPFPGLPPLEQSPLRGDPAGAGPGERAQGAEADQVHAGQPRAGKQPEQGAPAAQASPNSGGSAQAYTAALDVHTSQIYTLEAERAGQVVYRSGYGRLEVVRDAAPAVRVLQPEATVELDAAELGLLEVRALAQDDHGLAAAELVATLTSGSGEGVQFREHRVPLPLPEPGAPTAQTGTQLDLVALGLTPGDELYFHVEARDNRQPQPNLSRSETCFVRVRRTEQPIEASTEGIAVYRLPEYFRSQRQIIIDTEKLIADRPALSEAEFQRRSESLGQDQRLLRLRYGVLLGEEFESGAPLQDVAGAVPPGAAGHGGEPAGHHDEDHGGHGPGAPPEPPEALGSVTAEGIPEGLMHRHDTAESATFFADPVRTTLKAALAQMWDAEGRLRTFQPREALPHEYAALNLLKSLQEQSRIYVQRVGFDPPPLKPDEKRLSGDLSAIRDRVDETQRSGSPALPEVRAALRVLAGLRTGAAVPAQGLEPLEAAGRELARRAVDDPVQYLEAMEDLRTLELQLRERGSVCTECLPSVERALWGLLPPAQPGPGSTAPADSALYGVYRQRLTQAAGGGEAGAAGALDAP
jgi:hypothetical protein